MPRPPDETDDAPPTTTARPYSRYAVKSFTPPTTGSEVEPPSRLPPTTSEVEVPDPRAIETHDWRSGTEEFLNGAPVDPVAAAAPGITRPDLVENFRHSGWAPTRKRVETALTECPCVSPRRLSAFRACGCDAFVEAFRATHSDTFTDFRVRSTKCHDRFCVPCSNERSLRIRDSLTRHMYKRPNMSLITLTFAASDKTLTEILDNAGRCFRILRNWSAWKKAVKGGAAIIETKIGEGSGKWHVHYHVLAETGFLKQSDLSERWFEITGDSKIVDIRRVGAVCGAVSYITKYVTKAADPSIIRDPVRLRESIEAFTGRRLVSTFGTWRGLQLMERPDEEQETPEEKAKWRGIGPLDAIILRAEAGDAEAVRIMRRIAPRRFISRPTGPPLPPGL